MIRLVMTGDDRSMNLIDLCSNDAQMEMSVKWSNSKDLWYAHGIDAQVSNYVYISLRCFHCVPIGSSIIQHIPQYVPIIHVPVSNIV